MKKIMIFILAGIVLAVDIVSKRLIMANLAIDDSIEVIKNFFSITYLKNDGAAFSLFSNSRLFLIIVSAIVLIVIIYVIIKDKKPTVPAVISFGLLTGGLLGNLIDRIFRGYVVDFLSFKIVNYNFPVFNLGDACIVVAVLLFVYVIVWGDSGAKNKSSKVKSKN